MCLLLGLQHGAIVCLCSFYCDHSFSAGRLVLLKTNKTAKVKPLTEPDIQNNWWRWDCDQRKLIEVNYPTLSSLHLVCKCSTECVCVCVRVCALGLQFPLILPLSLTTLPILLPPPFYTHTHTLVCRQQSPSRPGAANRSIHRS